MSATKGEFNKPIDPRLQPLVGMLSHDLGIVIEEGLKELGLLSREGETTMPLTESGLRTLAGAVYVGIKESLANAKLIGIAPDSYLDVLDLRGAIMNGVQGCKAEIGEGQTTLGLYFEGKAPLIKRIEGIPLDTGGARTGDYYVDTVLGGPWRFTGVPDPTIDHLLGSDRTGSQLI